MSDDNSLFKDDKEPAADTRGSRSGFLAAGSWELTRLLRTGLLTRPLERPNDEDSAGWSLEVIPQEKVRERTGAVKVRSKRDVVIVLELDRRLLPDGQTPTSIPVAAVRRVHFRSSADLRELRDQYRGFADIDLDLIEWTHKADLFADEPTADATPIESAFDTVSTRQAFQGLAVGQVLHMARSLLANEQAGEPRWQWLADVYAAVIGEVQPGDGIGEFVACLAGNPPRVDGSLPVAFASAIVNLGGSRDPGASAIFELLAAALVLPEDDKDAATSIDWLRRVANQEELFDPSMLSDTSSKKEVHPFHRSVALLLLDPGLSRMLQYSNLPADQRPGEKVLFGAVLLAAALRSGRSWPEVDPPLPHDVKRDHSIRMAGALAHIAGNSHQAGAFHRLAGPVDRASEPGDDGRHLLLHLKGWQPPDSSTRTSLLTWRERDPAIATLEEAYLRIRNAVGNEKGIAGVELNMGTRSVRIRMNTAAPLPSEVVVSVVDGEPSPLIRFEGTLNVEEVRGKKPQTIAFLLKLLDIGRGIRCGFFADTDGPSRRPVTAVRFFSEQPVSTLDRDEISFHVDSIRTACTQTLRQITE